MFVDSYSATKVQFFSAKNKGTLSSFKNVP